MKRLAASFTIAGRNNGFGKADTRAVTLASVAAYREAMAGFAEMGTVGGLVCASDRGGAAAGDAPRRQGRQDQEANRRRPGGPRRPPRRRLAKARTRDSLQALSKLGELVDGRYRIVSQPPIVVPMRDLEATYGLSGDQIERALHEQFRAYRATLRDDQRQLLEQFELVDMARKVVGVGSVGTRAFIVLLQGRDQHDPLFLQVKEATRSVLEGPLPKSRYKAARRAGGVRPADAAGRQRHLPGLDQRVVDANRYFYWRQLRDMKGSAEVESMAPVALRFYAGICGWTLARAHARSGDPIAIAAYLGKGDTFDRSISDFAQRYADQNEQDYQAFADGDPIRTTASPRRRLRSRPLIMTRETLWAMRDRLGRSSSTGDASQAEGCSSGSAVC